MSSNQKSFAFAAVMCFICSLLLTGASVGLKPIQDKNVKIDQQKNILLALGIIDRNKTVKKADIESIYTSSVIEKYVKTVNGEQVIYAVTDESDNLSTYAIPFKAYGLWSWIYGFIALKGDGNTIAGMSVYKHGETPGLGGEVEKKWFLDQFIGKQIVDDNGNFVSIGVVKGKVSEKIETAKQIHYVDGMSGATLTNQGVENYLKETLASYEPFSKSLRSGELN